MKWTSVIAGLMLMLVPAVAEAQSARAATGGNDSSKAAALISRYRAANGLGPVSADGRLIAAAQQQARAIAQSGVLDHGDFAGRIASYGIRGKASENLALGVETVDQVISYWQTSSGHNANLLMPEFTKIGIAKVVSGRQYWALVLAR